MHLVFIGPPGAGKGTQCHRLANQYDIPHLSTGLILRQAKAIQSPLGKIVAPILDSGSLVSDEIMIRVVEERLQLQDCQRGFILDGFPRTIPQAEALGGQFGCELTAAVLLKVEREQLRLRLASRFHELENPRPEDQPEAIPKRLDIYEQVTRPLIKFYQERKLLVEVDGEGTPEAVFHRITAGLEQLIST